MQKYLPSLVLGFCIGALVSAQNPTSEELGSVKIVAVTAKAILKYKNGIKPASQPESSVVAPAVEEKQSFFSKLFSKEWAPEKAKAKDEHEVEKSFDENINFEVLKTMDDKRTFVRIQDTPKFRNIQPNEELIRITYTGAKFTIGEKPDVKDFQDPKLYKKVYFFEPGKTNMPACAEDSLRVWNIQSGETYAIVQNIYKKYSANTIAIKVKADGSGLRQVDIQDENLASLGTIYGPYILIEFVPGLGAAQASQDIASS